MFCTRSSIAGSPLSFPSFLIGVSIALYALFDSLMAISSGTNINCARPEIGLDLQPTKTEKTRNMNIIFFKKPPISTRCCIYSTHADDYTSAPLPLNIQPDHAKFFYFAKLNARTCLEYTAKTTKAFSPDLDYVHPFGYYKVGRR